MSTMIVGTRGSDLALWQTRHVSQLVRDAAQKRGESVEIKELIITTRGDVDMSDRLVGKLEKGFFTEELEQAQRDGRIDFAVHSLKDLPTRMPKGLALAAVLPRHRPVDLLIAMPHALDETRGEKVLPLKAGMKVGASSLRRDAMVKQYCPGAEPVPLRGNVPTRIKRLREGKVDVALLAAAGVERLGLDLSGLHVFQLNPKRWMPAPGQGAVGVQCREDDGRVRSALSLINDSATAEATEWERAFLRVLEGGCATPFGCHVDGGRAWLGQATEQGWKAKSVALPPVSGTAREDFINRVLSGKEKADGDDESWLFRKV
jgi:hydroxymethylbilane synthase